MHLIEEEVQQWGAKRGAKEKGRKLVTELKMREMEDGGRGGGLWEGSGRRQQRSDKKNTKILTLGELEFRQTF